MGKVLKGARLVDGAWVVKAPIETPRSSDAAIAARSEAEQQAEAIKLEALQQAEAIREAARQEGFAAGHAEGLRRGREAGLATGGEEARQELAALLERLRDGMEAGLEAYNAALMAMEPDLVRLALLVTERILHTEVHRPQAVHALVGAALTMVSLEQGARIGLSPADAHHLHALQAIFPPGGKVEAVLDPDVGAGGCVIETPSGRVDATLASQFAEVARALLQRDPDTDPALAPAVDALAVVPQADPEIPPAWDVEAARAVRPFLDPRRPWLGYD